MQLTIHTHCTYIGTNVLYFVVSNIAKVKYASHIELHDTLIP